MFWSVALTQEDKAQIYQLFKARDDYPSFVPDAVANHCTIQSDYNTNFFESIFLSVILFPISIFYWPLLYGAYSKSANIKFNKQKKLENVKFKCEWK